MCVPFRIREARDFNPDQPGDEHGRWQGEGTGPTQDPESKGMGREGKDYFYQPSSAYVNAVRDVVAANVQEYENRTGIGPCGALSHILVERGWGRMTSCITNSTENMKDAKPEDAIYRAYPHYVVTGNDGKIIDVSGETMFGHTGISYDEKEVYKAGESEPGDQLWGKEDYEYWNSKLAGVFKEYGSKVKNKVPAGTAKRSVVLGPQGEVIEVRYSEDQPRDEHGRWSSTGAGDKEDKTQEMFGGRQKEEMEFLRPEMSDHEAKAAIVRNMAREMGFPTSKVIVNEGHGKVFEVNGVKMMEAGHAEIYTTGNIVLFTGALGNREDVRGVTAHEIEHVRFEGVLKAYQQDYNDFKEWARTDREKFDAITFPNGEINPDSAASTVLPVYSKLGPMMDEKWEQLRDEDGVSTYSKTYWDGWKAGTVDRWRAVHETLAEIARQKESARAGDTKPTRLWKNVFKEVNELSKKGMGF